MAEKILGAKSGKREVSPGEIVEAEVDYVMLNDVTALPAIKAFRRFGSRAKPLGDRVILVQDHYVPNKDVPSAEQAKAMREFAREYGIEHYYEVGRGGICHQIILEEGFAAPGRLIVGADSHTCTCGALGAFCVGVGSTEAASAMVLGRLWFRVPESVKVRVEGELGRYVMGKDIVLRLIGDIGVDGALYRALEFHGSTIRRLSLSDRVSITNMAVEAGAKTGMIPPDEKVRRYLRGRVRGSYTEVHPDADAEYAEELTYDAGEIPPLVAKPYLPSNVVPAGELSHITIHQAYLGSCTNGRIEDLRIAAEILRGRQVHPDVRMIVVPASRKVQMQAVKEGLVEEFLRAGAFVSGPTCGACLGGYMGVLGRGERAISSTNRNFVGRMGHAESEVYLANPAVVAASAVTGRITDPSELD